jgi:hypothetical protein
VFVFCVPACVSVPSLVLLSSNIVLCCFLALFFSFFIWGSYSIPADAERRLAVHLGLRLPRAAGAGGQGGVHGAGGGGVLPGRAFAGQQDRGGLAPLPGGDAGPGALQLGQQQPGLSGEVGVGGPHCMPLCCVFCCSFL